VTKLRPPTVSVVMPTYNRASKLRAVVQSVLQQTFDDLELIIVDDGSTDGTQTILADLAREDNRIRPAYLPQNCGAPAARNAGLRVARGSWVALVDSDDDLLPISLEVRLAAARAEGVDVVHSDFYVWQAHESVPEAWGLKPLRGNVYRDLLRSPAYANPQLLVSASAIRRVAPLDERLVSYQDWDLGIALARHHKFGFVETPTFTWDQRAIDTISSDIRREVEGYEQVVAKRRREILVTLGPKALAAHYDELSLLNARAGNASASRRCSRVALLLWPGPRTLRARIGSRLRDAPRSRA
jgi:glycosyltransferase involved in cell wall biosynthesis